jgi:hypothetical protein
MFAVKCLLVPDTHKTAAMWDGGGCVMHQSPKIAQVAINAANQNLKICKPANQRNIPSFDVTQQRRYRQCHAVEYTSLEFVAD